MLKRTLGVNTWSYECKVRLKLINSTSLTTLGSPWTYSEVADSFLALIWSSWLLGRLGAHLPIWAVPGLRGPPITSGRHAQPGTKKLIKQSSDAQMDAKNEFSTLILV